ncbi:uncharacterized protein EDB91DRAFT_82594 [Suillus paluster]|uniref:uncharacterized protein n=1 Tax=Suillus paluster TaxID=48578 RepID=UPI001B86A460|nr:uncharacterized protein EDB91DRAFT_82594 [Suillus paluster]KAG1725811.1 hypothetical protein EDB91DRAFT_82594 [Suillus paluster]
MRFAALIAFAVISSTVPGFAAPAPYSPRWVASKRDTASTGVNTVVDTLVHNHTIPFRIGTVILPHANDTVPEVERLPGGLAVNGTETNPTLTSKRDTTSDIVHAIEAAFDGLLGARKRDVTADIATALHTILEAAGSVLSDVKRDSTSSNIEDRSIKPPVLSSSATTGPKNTGSLYSIGGDLIAIWNAINGSPSSSNTKRDLILTSDGVDITRTLGGAASQFEDRSFTIPSSVENALSKLASGTGVGGTVASVLSAFEGSGNSMKRELGVDARHNHDQKRVVSSDVESILRQIIAAYEGAMDG